MAEGQPGRGEQIPLKPFKFKFRHEDAVCRMYLDGKVKWEFVHTIQAINEHQAKVLAENTELIGPCGHSYRKAKRRVRGK